MTNIGTFKYFPNSHFPYFPTGRNIDFHGERQLVRISGENNSSMIISNISPLKTKITMQAVSGADGGNDACVPWYSITLNTDDSLPHEIKEGRRRNRSNSNGPAP